MKLPFPYLIMFFKESNELFKEYNLAMNNCEHFFQKDIWILWKKRVRTINNIKWKNNLQVIIYAYFSIGWWIYKAACWKFYIFNLNNLWNTGSYPNNSYLSFIYLYCFVLPSQKLNLQLFSDTLFTWYCFFNGLLLKSELYFMFGTFIRMVKSQHCSLRKV